MRTVILAVAVAASLAALAWSGAARAQNMIEAGDYVVHFNAIPSTDIPPEVARRHGITRSGARGLINVSVQRKGDLGIVDAKPVAADVTAAVTNLNGQRQDVNLREVRDGDAIYYLGTFRGSDGDTYRIELSMQPADAAQPIRASLTHEFFVDERG